MTAQKGLGTFLNIAFAIAIWFAIPIVMPVAATLAWVLIVLNVMFSFGMLMIIFQVYS
jgi:hypothetical protein